MRHDTPKVLETDCPAGTSGLELGAVQGPWFLLDHHHQVEQVDWTFLLYSQPGRAVLSAPDEHEARSFRKGAPPFVSLEAMRASFEARLRSVARKRERKVHLVVKLRIRGDNSGDYVIQQTFLKGLPRKVCRPELICNVVKLKPLR